MATSMHRMRGSHLLTRDDGAVAVLVALLLPIVLLGMAALAVDIGWWYVQSAKIQKAADGAALAGVTWMPQDFTNAKKYATKNAESNGYPNSRPGYVSTVTVTRASSTDPIKPTELRVTVKDEFDNFFGKVLGRPRMTIERTAVADFLAPAIMGSPCNGIGNQPPSTAGVGATRPAQPPGRAIPTELEGGYATCQSNPGFWVRIAGPNENKVYGDRYATKYCSGAENCTLNTNNEYASVGRSGYFFALRVPAAAVGKKLSVQVYDPAFVHTGSRCDDMGPFSPASAINDYEADSRADRYATVSNNAQRRVYCPGDVVPTNTSRDGPNTTFVVRQQTDTFNPLNADPVTCEAGSPITQFRARLDGSGNRLPPTTASLTKSNAADYNEHLARVFHQWYPLCTFTPSRAGDWYLQVRTNVSMGGTPLTDNGTNQSMISTGNAAALAEAGNDDTPGASGHNAYSLRADVNADGLVTADDALVSVAGYERLGIFSADDQTTQLWNLIRIDPNADGRAFELSTYDIGDWSPNADGRLTLLPPIGATNNGVRMDLPAPGALPVPNGVADPKCTGAGPVAGTLANCSVPVAKGAWNGRTETITVPIPPQYECSTTGTPDAPAAGDCWFRVKFDFPSGIINEDTTWDANLKGDPVRITE